MFDPGIQLDQDVEASDSEFKSVAYTAISFFAVFVLLISSVAYMISQFPAPVSLLASASCTRESRPSLMHLNHLFWIKQFRRQHQSGCQGFSDFLSEKLLGKR